MTNFLLLKLVEIHHSTFPRSQQARERKPGRPYNPAMDVEATARAVRQMLDKVKWAAVIAIWPDGSLTVEGIAFERRRVLGQPRRLPLTSFVAGPVLPSHEDICARLENALARQARAEQLAGPGPRL